MHVNAILSTGRTTIMTTAKPKTEFSVSHLKDSRFESEGLRPFFEYRDLGIKEATGGRVGAHVIRAITGAHGGTGWHTHDLEVQLVYVLKGWVEFSYEGVGEVRLEAGACVHQPPGIRHVEIAHSDDVEILEITLPAEFETHKAETAPAAASG
jgi:quercetin dioxygenase-like cupin family protein